MALSISCSMRLVTGAPNSNCSVTTTSAKFSTTENTRPWRWRSPSRCCVLGLASLILTLEICNFFVSDDEALAIASPPQLVNSRRIKKISRWSDKRKCPPWRSNSLEIIVPENLPRPSRRKNWEIVTDIEKSAPTIQVMTVKSVSGVGYCFSL